MDRIPGIDGAVKVSLPNKEQYDAVHSCSGLFVLNNRIWIVRFPGALGELCPFLSTVFRASTWHGQVDLCGLADQVARLGRKPAAVNFADLDFVEFLFFRLGTEARDEPFLVETVLLNSNGIEDVTHWAPFMHFLPHLHALVLNENPLKYAPTTLATDWLQVEVGVAKLPEPPREALARRTPWAGWDSGGAVAVGSGGWGKGGGPAFSYSGLSAEEERRPPPTVQVFEFSEPDAATLELLKHPVAIIGG
jgi:hypothetical protein